MMAFVNTSFSESKYYVHCVFYLTQNHKFFHANYPKKVISPNVCKYKFTLKKKFFMPSMSSILHQIIIFLRKLL